MVLELQGLLKPLNKNYYFIYLETEVTNNYIWVGLFYLFIFVYDIFFVSHLIHQALRERFAYSVYLYSVYFRYKKNLLCL